MLMAAVTSTSLGTDTTSIGTVSSERKGSVDTLFAVSFGEEAALAGEPPHVADPMKGMTAAEGERATAGKTASMVSVIKDSGANVATKAQGVLIPGKLPGQTGVGKTTVAHGSKASSSVPGRASQSSVTGTMVPPEMLDQPSPVPSGVEANKGAKVADAVAEAKTTDGTDGSEELDAEISAATTPVATVGDGKLTAAESVMPIADKSQQASSPKKISEEQDAPTKTDRSHKLEGKTEEKAEVGVTTVGSVAQATVCAVAPVGSTGGQQPGSEAAAEMDAFSVVVPAASGKNVGNTVAATGKDSKAASAKKPDEDKTKSSGPMATSVAAGDASSAKPEVDALKTGSSLTSDQESDKSKTQSMAVLIADAEQLHAVPAISGPVGGNVAGIAPIHNAGANPHMTETISHAVEISQAGTNAIDAPMPADTAHKTLAVTPTSIEVGVADGARGWLKIRAEIADGGAVNTSLSTSSPAGQEMLHRELPSLTAFLQNEHVTVNTVVVQPVLAGGAGPMNSFAGAGSGQGQPPQGNTQGDGRQPPADTSSSHARAGMLYNGPGDVGGDEALPSGFYAGGGSWLSVRA